MHPWEDWAETWAHYLHITDTVETAAACGIALRSRRADELVVNRALRLPDGYPFVLSPPAIEQMRFVHDTVGAAATSRP